MPPATTPGQHDAPTLRDPWLALGRTAVIAFGVSFIVLFVISIPVHYRALTTLCTSTESCGMSRLTDLEAAAMPAWLTLEAYASYQIALEAVLFMIALAVGALILYRASHTRMGLLTAAIMVFLGFATETLTALTETVPMIGTFIGPAFLAGFVLLWLFVMVFPNGKVEPGWVRRRFRLMVIAVVILNLLTFLTFSYFVAIFWLLTYAFALGVQVIRYRRHATPEQRQQVKWVLVGIGFALFYGFVIWDIILDPTTSPVLRGTPRFASNLLNGTLNLITIGLFPVTIAFAILRRRLWDVDLIINRALVYGTLTVTLTTIYLGTVVLLQRVVLAGQDSSLVVAGSTLLIAALFAPLRRRIQTLIDRRFYRRKYDSQKALAAFAATARSQVDLEALKDELLQVVGNTVQPQQVSLWLKPNQERPSRAFEASSSQGALKSDRERKI